MSGNQASEILPRRNWENTRKTTEQLGFGRLSKHRAKRQNVFSVQLRVVSQFLRGKNLTCLPRCDHSDPAITRATVPHAANQTMTPQSLRPSLRQLQRRLLHV